MNEWDYAVELAEKHNFPQIHALLTKYASNLLENSGIQGKINAVELYRKAGKSVEAASILTELASDAASNGNLVRAKKFQVLAALEVETFRERTLNNNTGSTTMMTETKESKTTMTAQQTLAGLMTLETAVTTDGSVMANAKAMDNAWRGAEAYHFEILAHKLLYVVFDHSLSFVSLIYIRRKSLEHATPQMHTQRVRKL